MLGELFMCRVTASENFRLKDVFDYLAHGGSINEYEDFSNENVY